MPNPITLSSFVTAARQNEGRLVVNNNNTVAASGNMGDRHVTSASAEKKINSDNQNANNEFAKVMRQAFGEKIAGQAIGTALQDKTQALTGRTVLNVFQHAKQLQDDRGLLGNMYASLMDRVGLAPSKSHIRETWHNLKPHVNVEQRARGESDATVDSLDLHDMRSFATFVPKGVSEAAAMEFLMTHDDGKLLMANIARNTANWDDSTAEKKASNTQTRLNIALQQVMSGERLPTRLQLNVGDELVKITKRGETPSAYSPYFTTRAALEQAIRTVDKSDPNRSIAAVFGLPLGSIDAKDVYDVHVIRVTQATSVLTSTVAPTEELGSHVKTPGGAMQILMSRADAENVTTTIKERADTSGVGASVIRTVGDLFKVAQSQLGFGS
ncbi:hypothetical protein HCH_03319 [Hahella chejuensis KCTC 2396]|uniref:Uncharacterized protein n=1 Tax=Hahella chejuensis (strain KCTC 2396) TaxID=349521 RepID=Q2SH00_HAHCH|nr:hypothetical protein [Hahella chejuensis]ABC30074.1 hypothetical protein HCH_03319 [Hahella chejuensis KCTC 2396]